MAFSDNLFVLNHSKRSFVSELTFWKRSLFDLCAKYIVVSSANRRGLQFDRQFGRSFIYNKNNKGPKTLPWGTPHVMGKAEDLELLCTGYISLLLRQL